MERTRRGTLGLVGGTATALLAGCLVPGGSDASDGSADGDDSDGSTVPGTDTDDGADTPSGGGGLPEDLDRVDAPPYDVEAIECQIGDDGEGNRDPLYLCSNMPAEPSLAFEQVSTRGNALREGLTGRPDDYRDHRLYAALLTEETDVERVDPDSDEPHELVAGTDFDTHAVLVVQTGWGSGSIRPHLKRVAATDTGVHAFGCYRRPCVWTDDLTVRSTVARFERPETLAAGVVSLTVDPSTRFNVAAGEGVVTVEDDEANGA